MDSLTDKLNEIASSGMKNDQMLLDLCKSIVETIDTLHKIVATQSRTIEILTETATIHNRALRSINADRIDDAGQDTRFN